MRVGRQGGALGSQLADKLQKELAVGADEDVHAVRPSNRGSLLSHVDGEAAEEADDPVGPDCQRGWRLVHACLAELLHLDQRHVVVLQRALLQDQLGRGDRAQDVGREGQGQVAASQVTEVHAQLTGLGDARRGQTSGAGSCAHLLAALAVPRQVEGDDHGDDEEEPMNKEIDQVEK